MKQLTVKTSGLVTEDTLGEIRQLILDIFNQDIPFTQTTRLTTCENCDFRHLCGR